MSPCAHCSAGARESTFKTAHTSQIHRITVCVPTHKTEGHTVMTTRAHGVRNTALQSPPLAHVGPSELASSSCARTCHCHAMCCAPTKPRALSAQAPRVHREARAAHHGARQSNAIAHSYTAPAWPAARTSRDGHATAGGGCSLIVRLMSPESAREYAAGFWYRTQLRAQRSWLGLGLGSGSGSGLGLGLGLGFA